MTRTKQNWVRRSLSLLMALMICMSVISVTAFAQETTQSISEQYSVPIKSLTSAAPLPSVQTAFAGAFGESVTVIVNEDGSKTAVIKSHHMIISFMGNKYDANVASIVDADTSLEGTQSATILSTKEEVYTKGMGGSQETITVPDELTIPLNLDKNNSQKLSITVDFMDAFLGNGNPYPTTVTLTLDMENEVHDTTEKMENTQVSDPNKQIDITNLSDGTYEIPVELWHATQNKASMAASSFNDTARIVVDNGKITVYVYTKPMTFGVITASLQEMKIEQADGVWVDAVVETKSNDGNPTCFSFTLDKLNQYTTVKVNPHVEMMGNQDLDARLKFDLNAIKQFSSESTENGANIENPHTGDTSNLTLCTLLMFASLSTFVILSFAGKRKKVTNK